MWDMSNLSNRTRDEVLADFDAALGSARHNNTQNFRNDPTRAAEESDADEVTNHRLKKFFALATEDDHRSALYTVTAGGNGTTFEYHIRIRPAGVVEPTDEWVPVPAGDGMEITSMAMGPEKIAELEAAASARSSKRKR